jgi:hypothetical protein
VTDAIERAKELGTLNKIDRSHQYTRPDNPELLRSLNEAWSKIRTLEAASLRKDNEIATLHNRLGKKWIGNLVAGLISAGVALAWEIGTKFAPIVMRWLGLA